VKVVQNQLGHALIDVILDAYSHLFAGSYTSAVASLNAQNLIK
jgi:hypothetical protein